MNRVRLLQISIVLNILFGIIIVFLGFKHVKKIIKNNFSSQKVEIIMYGDSHIAYGNWEELLNRKDVLKQGFPGFTSSNLALMTKFKVIDYKPKICFIMVGINDIVAGIPLKRIKSNYKTILNDLKGNNIKPIIQSVLYQVNNPGNNILVDSINTFLVNYCVHNDMTYLDLNCKLSNPSSLKPENSTDGSHLNERGYKIWAKEIELTLNKIETGQY